MMCPKIYSANESFYRKKNFFFFVAINNFMPCENELEINDHKQKITSPFKRSKIFVCLFATKIEILNFFDNVDYRSLMRADDQALRVSMCYCVWFENIFGSIFFKFQH